MAVVFDASALLVLLNKEAGFVLVEKYLTESVMSAVNFAEVITLLVSVGVPQAEAVALSSELITEIVSFNVEHAAMSAALRAITKPFGLSLGDRACLALAQQRCLPVITADKIWSGFDLGVHVILAR